MKSASPSSNRTDVRQWSPFRSSESRSRRRSTKGSRTTVGPGAAVAPTGVSHGDVTIHALDPRRLDRVVVQLSGRRTHLLTWKEREALLERLQTVPGGGRIAQAFRDVDASRPVEL